MSDDTITVGVLYPPEWYRDDVGFRASLDQIRAVDPRVRVIAECYVEPHELRSVRVGADAHQHRDKAPELTDAQRDALAAIDVAVAIDLPFDVAMHAPNLRWVQCVGAGSAQLQSAGLADAGIRLTSGAGVNAVAIAEFAVARVLQHWKRFREFDELQAAHDWGSLFGRQLAGATVGLIGLGNINAATAARLQAFDVRVLATRRSATPGATAPDVDELYPTTELHTMLAQCDAVICAVPETSATAQLDGPRRVRRDEAAQLLRERRPRVAGRRSRARRRRSSRATSRAPPSTSRARSHFPPTTSCGTRRTSTSSPHTSSAPDALFVNLTELFCTNLARFLAGEELINEVDDSGY